MFVKQCPLLQGTGLKGGCDYPDLLEKFPSHMREQCADNKGKCLLRRVAVIDLDGDGKKINIVQAKELIREYSHQGRYQCVPLEQINRSILRYVSAVSTLSQCEGIV